MSITDFSARFSAHFSQKFSDLIDENILVALSGGKDSVALLHVLAQCKLSLEAAYVNHGSRPHEVKQEISLCRTMCDELDIPFHVLHIDHKDPQRSIGSREADWRRQRYEALATLADERGFAAIATAHHRDDVAEGVLLQLLRGGGPRAMAGIHERTEKAIMRPLLPFQSYELVEWLQERNITWCEDSSNDDTSHLRNRIRHEILPLLERTTPALRGHLVNLAQALAEDEHFIQDELVKRAVWIDPWSPEGGVKLDDVRQLSPALRSRWLHAQARRIGIERVSRSQLALFAQMIETGTGGSVNLGRRWRIRLVKGIVWLEPPSPPGSFEYRLSRSSEVELPIPGWMIAIRSESEPLTPGAMILQVPVGARIVARSRLRGENIVENGQTKSVRALLARKLPRHLRNAWPLVLVDDTICWIPGVWQGPKIRVPRTQRVEVFRR